MNPGEKDPNAALIPLTDSMAIYDQFEENYFAGVLVLEPVLENGKYKAKEVYSEKYDRNANLIVEFTEKDGTYHFRNNLDGKMQAARVSTDPNHPNVPC